MKSHPEKKESLYNPIKIDIPWKSNKHRNPWNPTENRNPMEIQFKKNNTIHFKNYPAS